MTTWQQFLSPPRPSLPKDFLLHADHYGVMEAPQRRRRDPWNSRVRTSFMLLAAVAVVTGSGLSVLVKRLIDADRDETRSYEQVGRLQELQATSRSAVSNLRAFILTGRNSDQESVQADLGLAKKALAHYSELQPSNIDSALLVRALGRLGSSATRIADMRRQFGAGIVPTIAQDRETEDAIVALDRSVSDVLASRAQSLEAWRDQRQQEYLLTELAFAGTMLFGSLALVVAGIGLKREAARRLQVEAEHQSAKHELSTAQALLQLNEKKDAVTGVLNREAFDEILTTEYQKALKAKTPLCVVVLELDHLRPILASRGKETADMVLAQTASILKDSFRGGDICCRLGDTEFGVVLPRTHLQNASIAAERARKAIERADWSGCTVTGSFGVAQADYQRDALELMTRAQQAMDYARRTGHNRVTAIKSYLPMAA